DFSSLRDSSPTVFSVLAGNFVSDTSGTGVVHCAPAFGEEDFDLCVAFQVIKPEGEDLVVPIDDAGRFTSQIPSLAGVYFKDADSLVLQLLEKNSRLVRRGVVHHMYPFRWRSDTPLIYKAVPCWFVRVAPLA